MVSKEKKKRKKKKQNQRRPLHLTTAFAWTKQGESECETLCAR